ncbi:BQ5605_C007g04817 [Microbotryum silenes-dioicae]|uniref:Lysophospholipase n=1 Tax=Microbotryum silenes-dioicae TaxID=796604 RepID=A0A2X0M805_9BASI|nr:BQ5605_C007g04817 [Microbotryum silenes-dioicae]
MWALGGIAGSVLWICAVNGQGPSYAPRRVRCPTDGPLVKSTGSPLAGNQFLESREAAYQATRWNKVLEPLYLKYLGNGQDTGYSTAQIATIVKHEPRIGTACSGGGLRASLYCAGTLSALDSRSRSHAAPVLQLSAYMTGLSGGSWAITSLATSNLGPTSIYDIVLGKNGAPGWKLDFNLIFPSIKHLIPFNANIIRDLHAKTRAHFSVTLIDYWGKHWLDFRASLSECAGNHSQPLAGRLLGHHFLPGTTRASFFSQSAPNDNGLLFDAIKSTSKFKEFEMPYPIVTTTSRVRPWDQFQVRHDYIPAINTVFEISPYSFGSFDPSLSAHIPTEYMGSYVEQTQTGVARTCVNGFDSASFIMGCSAGLFTAIESMLQPDMKTFRRLLSLIHRVSKEEKLDILTSKVKLAANLRRTVTDMRLLPNVVPNTFYGYNSGLMGSRRFESAENKNLYLTDGGMNGENIPLAPLLVKARRLDTIFAIDASQDTKMSWPNGVSLHRTWERINRTANGYSDFPPVPSKPYDFLMGGLTRRPVFFGCNVKDARVDKPGNYPILIYLPNAPVPHSGYSTNTKTSQMEYSISDTEAFLNTVQANAMKGYPGGDAVVDREYKTALKCATVDRARQRGNMARSAICQIQMQRCEFLDSITEWTCSRCSRPLRLHRWQIAGPL